MCATSVMTPSKHWKRLNHTILQCTYPQLGFHWHVAYRSANGGATQPMTLPNMLEVMATKVRP